MDGLTLAASIAGLVSVAQVVVEKGYRYLKAVKNCDDEVRKLIVETNVFCGIVERLARLAEDEEEEDGLYSTEPVKIPDHVYACQKTLNEILSILRGFERKASRASAAADPSIASPNRESSASAPKPSKRTNILSRLTLTDLKWPLSRSRTLELISDLERHKSTCILALSVDELATMHSVLEQTNMTQKIVTEIRSDQKNFMDVALAQNHDKKVREIIEWLSPVGPELYHQSARNLRQRGTGRWIFDLPEYTKWIEGQNTGLWIYGIPGAGKTILASLVIDELCATKQAGVAYFYCDYRNAESQKPTNIIGSLISQLSLQDPAALKEIVSCYSTRHPEGRPPTCLDESELCTLLKSVLQKFTTATFIIDGLDECGSSIDLDRREFVRTLASFRNRAMSAVRLVIFSREEGDIRAELADFSSVSIAAHSSDIQLFVAAKAGSLKIKDEALQAEIIEALIHGADGMFQWVRCQIDYIGGLPNNRERRKALKDLPPTLPATYERILDRIDSRYPPQTQLYIQRIFKWLVLADEIESTDVQRELNIQALAQAICVEEGSTQLDREVVPDVIDVSDWCGSLTRTDPRTQTLELSHYTVKEFLLSNENSIPFNSAARKYLVNRRKDQNYIVHTCLTYLSLDGLGLDVLLAPIKVTRTGTDYGLRRSSYSSFNSAFKAFRVEYPFYEYCAHSMYGHLQRYQHANHETKPFQSVFRVSSGKLLSYYTTFVNMVTGDLFLEPNNPTTLQVATSLLLVQTVKRLLLGGADPDERIELDATPLHCAIRLVSSGNQAFATEFTHFNEFGAQIEKPPAVEARRLLIVESLIAAGANVNAVALQTESLCEMSPLCLAILYKRPAICKLLLEAGAKIAPESEGLGKKYESLRDFLFEFRSFEDSTAMEEVLTLIQRQSTDPLLHAIIGVRAENGEILERSLCFRNGRQSRSLSLDLMRDDLSAICGYDEYLAEHVPLELKTGGGFDRPTLTSQCHLASEFCPFEGKDDEFTLLATRKCKLLSEEARYTLIEETLKFDNEDRIRSLICTEVELYGQDRLFPTIHLACMTETSRFLEFFIQKGTDTNLRADGNDTPLIIAARRGRIDIVELLIRNNADVSRSGSFGWTALHHAARVPAPAIVEMLIENGASVYAKGDDGSNALHLAVQADAVEVSAYLISKGIKPGLQSKDDNSPLHHAGASDARVDTFLNPELSKHERDFIDGPSATSGTPLYAAAKRGSVSIARKLLDAGADVDKAAVPQNVLGPPLFAACAHGHCEVVELLLSRGAKTEVLGCQYRTALEISKAYAHWGVVEILERWEQSRTPVRDAGIGDQQQQSNPMEKLESELSAQIGDLKALLDRNLQLAPKPADNATGPEVLGEV